MSYADRSGEPPMKIGEITARLDHIALMARERGLEFAYVMQELLRNDVLAEIARGHPEPRALAEAVLSRDVHADTLGAGDVRTPL